jgi:fructokinase
MQNEDMMPIAPAHDDEALLYGGVDAGGTKFLCAIGTSPGRIERIATIKTTDVDATLDAVAHFFKAWRVEGKRLDGLGIACFGPLIRDPSAEGYGRLGNSPKPGWASADVRGGLFARLDLPIAIDTDVNGAALAEGRWGAARGKRTYAYVTIGTGIGAGIVSDGRLVNGISHPELGHYRPPRHPRDRFGGICPFHGDCLEGLACGPAIAARCGDGRTAEDLANDDEIWPIIAHYVAHLCSILIFAFAPERIILGGGVVQRDALFAMIRTETKKMLAGYLGNALYSGDRGNVIVPSGFVAAQGQRLLANAGVCGGFILAEQAVRRNAKD